MAVQRPSTVRPAALRRSAFSLTGVLDRVEVGTVGRKVEQPRSRRLDRHAHPRSLVAGQVVHDDDVAGRQFRHEPLVDIGLDRVAVDRPVERHWGDEPGEA